MLAFLASPPELFVPAVLLALIGLALIALAHFWPDEAGVERATRWPFVLLRRRRVVTHVAPVESMPAAEANEITGAVYAFARAITWPSLVDPDAGALEADERKRVIDGLGIVGDAWSAGILARAFEEEDGELRVAAIESLGLCDGEIVAPTLERAYSSYVVAERYAAVDGASRRGEVALLEKALRDTDGTVALAAAYGLHRARRDDLIEGGLAGREDARANEIRRVLPMLV